MVKATEKTSRAFRRRARILKQSESHLTNVYIQQGLPPAINKRLTEMKHVYKYRMKYSGEEAFVKNKKLYMSGMMVDEFVQDF